MNYYNVLIKLLDEQRQSWFDQTFLMSKCYYILIRLFDKQLLSSFDQVFVSFCFLNYVSSFVKLTDKQLLSYFDQAF